MAGTSTSHGADDNRYKINLLLKHDDSTTFGMEELLCGVNLEEAYEAVAHHLGAIAAGIPTVTIMDTNDPALAIVAQRGADLTVIPMDDNRPLNSYAAALEVLKAVP